MIRFFRRKPKPAPDYTGAATFLALRQLTDGRMVAVVQYYPSARVPIPFEFFTTLENLEYVPDLRAGDSVRVHDHRKLHRFLADV